MCTEDIYDDFTVVFGEVDFGAETEAFFRDENGGEMRTLFEDTESFVFFVFVKGFPFGEAVFV